MKKELNEAFVLEQTEILINKYNSTSTIDVKNRLKTAGYKAFHSDIDKMLRKIALQEGWKILARVNNTFFSFGEDTSKSLHIFLKKEEEIWEAQIIAPKFKILWLRENNQVIRKKFSQNRKLVKHIQKQVKIKEKEGFKKLQVPKLKLSSRAKFIPFFEKQPQALHLGFFNVKQKVFFRKEEYSEDFESLYNVGGEFIWQRPFDTIDSFLKNENLPDYVDKNHFSAIQLTGKKHLKTTTRNKELQSKTLIKYLEKTQVTKEIFDFNVATQYHIKIYFEDKKSLSLSIFDEQDTEIMEELRAFLKEHFLE